MLGFTIFFLTILFLGIAGSAVFAIGYVVYQVAIYFGTVYFNGNQWVPIGLLLLVLYIIRGIKNACKSLVSVD